MNPYSKKSSPYTKRKLIYIKVIKAVGAIFDKIVFDRMEFDGYEDEKRFPFTKKSSPYSKQENKYIKDC